MARQHLDELRQELQDMGWVVESVDPSPDTHLCGIWMLRHRSGALRCVEFTAASKGSKRFEESHGCHLQNARPTTPISARFLHNGVTSSSE
ncbi:MAG: hypothetical protein AB7F75_06140 [Planctomycetota bacterium]